MKNRTPPINLLLLLHYLAHYESTTCTPANGGTDSPSICSLILEAWESYLVSSNISRIPFSPSVCLLAQNSNICGINDLIRYDLWLISFFKECSVKHEDMDTKTPCSLALHVPTPSGSLPDSLPPIRLRYVTLSDLPKHLVLTFAKELTVLSCNN